MNHGGQRKKKEDEEMKSIGAHITGTMKRVARVEITGYMIASMKQSIKFEKNNKYIVYIYAMGL